MKTKEKMLNLLAYLIVTIAVLFALAVIGSLFYLMGLYVSLVVILLLAGFAATGWALNRIAD
jgi:hypothetical protein